MSEGLGRVAVIGGGPAGVCAVKCCVEEGLVPTCYEQHDDIGMLNYYPHVGHSQQRINPICSTACTGGPSVAVPINNHQGLLDTCNRSTVCDLGTLNLLAMVRYLICHPINLAIHWRIHGDPPLSVPNGTKFFRFHIHFRQKAPTLEVDASNGKSWIHPCHI